MTFHFFTVPALDRAAEHRISPAPGQGEGWGGGRNASCGQAGRSTLYNLVLGLQGVRHL